MVEPYYIFASEFEKICEKREDTKFGNRKIWKLFVELSEQSQNEEFHKIVAEIPGNSILKKS